MATTPYLTVESADTYFGERLGTSKWDSASATDKEKALKQATRLIDTLNFIGEKTDDEQPNEFPRDGDDAVPPEVKDATCEVALALLEGNTLEAAASASEVQSESAGDASVSYREKGKATVIGENFGLPSPTAARLLAPWIADPRELGIRRV